MAENWRERFDQIWKEPSKTARQWKEKTKGKVVGFCLPDAPEEIILASGALPLALLGKGIAFSRADAHFQSFACSYSRSLLELIERGELDFLDAIIIPHTCDAMRAFDLVVKSMDRFEMTESYRLPRLRENPCAEKYFREELDRLRNKLAELTGHYPDSEEIRQACGTLNKLKSLFGQLKKELKDQRISAGEFFSALRASLVGDRQEMVSLIEQFLLEIKNRTPKEQGFKIILAGKVAEPPEIIDEIERAGFVVVDDLLALGSRWIESKVDTNIEPISALIKAQFEKLPFAGLVENREKSRAQWIIEAVRNSGAHAVIYLLQRFCEPYELEVVGIEEELKQAQIPFLRLETDYQTSSLPPLRTRLDAFYEMLSEQIG